ncbi:MAG: metallophosphoesterase, partial [Planctomycetota bacterium]
DPPGREQRWREKVDKVLGMVRTLGAPVVWVPGNHDQRGYEAEPGNADGRLIELAGVRIVGIGGAGPKSWGFRYEWTDDDIRKLELPECDILLSHTPPLDTALDCSNSGMSGGSAAILERAKKHRGVLLCGHIHEAFGTERIRNCFGYNAGSLGNPYGATRIGMLDWDAQRGRVTITHYNLDINDEEQVEFKLPARAT